MRCAFVSLLIFLAPHCVDDSRAQSYPAKVVRVVVPTTPGSGADVIGRIVAEGLTQVFGQQVIVENRGGASSNIGAEFVARAPADGYTLLQASMTLAANVSLFRNLSYNLLRDFAPVTLVAVQPHIIVVHPSLPVKSVRDLIRLAKARPGALSYSPAGAGTTTHLTAELFRHMAGVNLLHVPYNGGGPALTAVLSGEVMVYFAPLPTSFPLARAGKLRALAVTTGEPFSGTPEYPSAYPTIAEAGGHILTLDGRHPRACTADPECRSAWSPGSQRQQRRIGLNQAIQRHVADATAAELSQNAIDLLAEQIQRARDAGLAAGGYAV